MKRLLAISAVIIWAASTDSQQPYAETQSAAAPDCGIDGFYVWRETVPNFDDLSDLHLARKMQQVEGVRFAFPERLTGVGERFRREMPQEYGSLTNAEVSLCLLSMGRSITSADQAIYKRELEL